MYDMHQCVRPQQMFTDCRRLKGIEKTVAFDTKKLKVTADGKLEKDPCAKFLLKWAAV